MRTSTSEKTDVRKVKESLDQALIKPGRSRIGLDQKSLAIKNHNE
jgi:hypothetical protein